MLVNLSVGVDAKYLDDFAGGSVDVIGQWSHGHTLPFELVEIMI